MFYNYMDICGSCRFSMLYQIYMRDIWTDPVCQAASWLNNKKGY